MTNTEIYPVVVETNSGMILTYFFANQKDELDFITYANKQSCVSRVYSDNALPLDLKGNCELLDIQIEDEHF